MKIKKLMGDRIQFEFLERDDLGNVWFPEFSGSDKQFPWKKAKVIKVGPEVQEVKPGDIIGVKNFKPIEFANGESLLLCKEGNVLFKYAAESDEKRT